MLLQFPVFIGLYQTLGQAIELRQRQSSAFLGARPLLGARMLSLAGAAAHRRPCNDFSMFRPVDPGAGGAGWGASMLLQQYMTPVDRHGSRTAGG